MTPKRRRLAGILFMLLVLGTAVALTLAALEDSVVFFHSPTDIATRDDLRKDKRMRVGGLVKERSLRREDGVRISFVITDLENEVRVQYRGILPDLFREGQGIVAEGRLVADGSFLADEVLAKHDENYMPPEVAEALRKSGRWRDGSGAADRQ